MPYQVFVERPSSPAPDALERLAAAIAERYGLPAPELEPRLRAGRFRVKANVDRDTAERFALDLERLGAVVSVVGDDGAAIARGAAATPRPAPAPAPAPIAKPAPAPVAKPAAPAPAAGPPPRPSAPSFSSGLAAAFGASSDDSPDLGALGGDSGTFSLASLDGSDERPAAASGSFAPPGADAAALPASIGPAIAPPAAAAPAPSASAAPIDMFAPPDAEAPMDLAVDVADVKPKRAGTMSTPPPAAGAAAPARTSGRVSAPPPMTMAAEPAAVAAAPPSRGGLGDRVRDFAGNARARFAAGAVLAVLLGFLPAHLLQSVRERSAFAEIDGHLVERQAAVRSAEEWDALDKLREAQREDKIAEKHSLAMVSVLLWAAVSAGFAFVWFRKIDWDRIAAG